MRAGHEHNYKAPPPGRRPAVALAGRSSFGTPPMLARAPKSRAHDPAPDPRPPESHDRIRVNPQGRPRSGRPFFSAPAPDPRPPESHDRIRVNPQGRPRSGR